MYFQQTNARNVYVYYAQIFMILQGRRKGGEFIFFKGGGVLNQIWFEMKIFFNVSNYFLF